MSVDFTCGELAEQTEGALVAYLYGECGAAERSVIEAHLAICAACATELASLGATRSALASWTPPETELGFQIVSMRDTAPPASNVLRPARWWQRPMPAWAQAAAAIVIFAVGGLLGMRAGGTESERATAVALAPAPAAATPTMASMQDLAALEQRLRREMSQLRAASAPAQPIQVAASDPQLLQRVRAMLDESERQQQREFELRLSQVLRDVDVQRRVDLARIEQTFGQMEGLTGAEVQDQRKAINYLMRVAHRPQ